MKTLLTLAAAGTMLSTAALAQTSASAATTADIAKTPEANISTPALPPSSGTASSTSSLDLQKDFRTDLVKAGFTDVRVKPDSFLVEAKDHDGHPVTMLINPDSVTEVIGEGTSGTRMTRSDAGTDNAGNNGPEFPTLQASDRMSSKIVGLEVQNSANKDIGTIKDIAYAGRRVQAYVIDVGGFLGIGSHQVAVDPSDVKIIYDSNSHDWHATMNTTAAQLKSAPEFKYPARA